METTVVSDNGEVTIPLDLRRRLGLQKGSRVLVSLVGDHLEIRVAGAPKEGDERSGFGMLKSDRKAVPADLDPAELISR